MTGRIDNRRGRSPALRGVTFTAQGAVLDPASPPGLAMTQGLLVTIGD